MNLRSLSAALKRALSGPFQPIDEGQKNRDGRNIWYELAPLQPNGNCGVLRLLLGSRICR
jgi:hypothetical protein